MKNLRFALSAAMSVIGLSILSCSPQYFPIEVEMRYPSSSGLDLAGKSMAVVYVDDGSEQSAFAGGLADGLAKSLETEYFYGEQTIDIFSVSMQEDADYSDRDTLINLIMETGRDVVLLIDRTHFGEAVPGENEAFTGRFSDADSSYVCTVRVPFTMTVHAYDSMNKEDRVLSFSGSGTARALVYNNGQADAAQIVSDVWKFMEPAGERAGHSASGSFLNVWRNESYAVIYYDMSSWDKPSRAVYNYQWKEAIDDWLKLVDTGNEQRRACAEYDIALGCYMLGQYELALRWLDQADADYPISLSGTLRKRIEERIR